MSPSLMIANHLHSPIDVLGAHALPEARMKLVGGPSANVQRRSLEHGLAPAG